jgi:hypothetical protein
VVYHITQVDPNLATLGAQVCPEDAHPGRAGSALLTADHPIRSVDDMTWIVVDETWVE